MLFRSQTDLSDSEYAESVIKKSLTKTFAPEFINRIDEIITFNPLNQESIVKIVDLEVKKLVSRVKKIGYTLEVSPEAEEFIAKVGYDPQFGARPLQRAIQTHLEDNLSELIVASKLTKGDTITVVPTEEGKKLDFKVIQPTE